MRPTVDIEWCTSAHERLNALADTLTAADAARPSLLPGWTIAHLLGHLAANADSVVRRLRGAIDDQVVDQYPGGSEGRAREIEERAAETRDDLVAAVRASSAAVDEIFTQMPDDAWERTSRGVSGAVVPASQLAFARWREVELHLVDLGIGPGVGDLPEALVHRWLPELVAALPDRADGKQLLGWLTGRSPAPELGPWG